MNVKLLEAVLAAAIFVVVVSAFAQTWTQTSAPNAGGGWEAIAMSADGKKAVAVTSTAPPVVSADSGVTWTTNVVFHWFNQIASSADGTKWIAVFYSAPGYIYVSTDSGNTWTQTSSPNSSSWRAVASSADGNKLFAAIYNGSIYLLTNSGTTWTTSSAPSKEWTWLASSADGTKVAATAQNDKIYSSTDSGMSWTATGSSNDSWSSIASSADGTRLVASSGGGVYVSTNSGGSWTLVNTNSGQVASSADGTKLVIGGGSIYTSSNSGLTWVSNSAPVSYVPNYSRIASSADGCKMFALIGGGLPGIWTGQIAPASTLNINSSASTGAVLSWLVPSTNFVLQQNSDLSTTNWTDVTDTPVLNLTNLQNQVILSPSGSNVFYRLKTP
ncbi:MAG: hypothetical protein ABSC89_16965 [Verrucomicrobiota bacterium]|jgi:photosystem II stability/assembly factor-like uncharacterized protein